MKSCFTWSSSVTSASLPGFTSCFFLFVCVSPEIWLFWCLCLSEGTVQQSVQLRVSAGQRRVRLGVFRPEAVWWTAGQTSFHSLYFGNSFHSWIISDCGDLWSWPFMSLQVAIKQISNDRVQKWARLVSYVIFICQQVNLESKMKQTLFLITTHRAAA